MKTKTLSIVVVGLLASSGAFAKPMSAEVIRANNTFVSLSMAAAKSVLKANESQLHIGALNKEFIKLAAGAESKSADGEIQSISATYSNAKSVCRFLSTKRRTVQVPLNGEKAISDHADIFVQCHDRKGQLLIQTVIRNLRLDGQSIGSFTHSFDDGQTLRRYTPTWGEGRVVSYHISRDTNSYDLNGFDLPRSRPRSAH